MSDFVALTPLPLSPLKFGFCLKGAEKGQCTLAERKKKLKFFIFSAPEAPKR